MKLTPAMKKRIAHLNTETFEIVEWGFAPAARRDLLAAGKMVQGEKKANIYGIMRDTYKLTEDL